eukprot:716758-Rhodomonas_salina.1
MVGTWRKVRAMCGGSCVTSMTSCTWDSQFEPHVTSYGTLSADKRGRGDGRREEDTERGGGRRKEDEEGGGGERRRREQEAVERARRKSERYRRRREEEENEGKGEG